jgi:hypothetical protein
MSDFEISGEPPPSSEIAPVSAIDDDDVPARRLLAHDLEHMIWDDDGPTGPPPD